MSYGNPSVEQKAAIKRHIQGSVVHDLGAGNLILSKALLALGAAEVVAVDKQVCRQPTDKRIRLVKSYFADYYDPVSVAFISWPQNYTMPGLVRLVEGAGVVLYLGSNTGGSACGFRELFEHFVTREVLDYLPRRSNTLIVYGPRRVTREPRGEELAALTSPGHMWMFDEVESA